MRLPVKKDGTNMPSTCSEITQCAAACGRPQATIASGEAPIRKDIMPKEIMAATTAATKRGWAAISSSGRGGGRAAPGAEGAPSLVSVSCGEGKRMKDMIVK